MIASQFFFFRSPVSFIIYRSIIFSRGHYSIYNGLSVIMFRLIKLCSSGGLAELRRRVRKQASSDFCKMNAPADKPPNPAYLSQLQRQIHPISHPPCHLPIAREDADIHAALRLIISHANSSCPASGIGPRPFPAGSPWKSTRPEEGIRQPPSKKDVVHCANSSREQHSPCFEAAFHEPRGRVSGCCVRTWPSHSIDKLWLDSALKKEKELCC